MIHGSIGIKTDTQYSTVMGDVYCVDFYLLHGGVNRTACRCAVGRIAISRVRGRCNLNPAVIERSIGVRW